VLSRLFPAQDLLLLNLDDVHASNESRMSRACDEQGMNRARIMDLQRSGAARR
jgi:hypothetical protein